MSHFQKNFGKNKLLPYLWELGPNFSIQASSPKIEKVHISSVPLIFLYSVSPLLKFHNLSKMLIKKLEILPFFDARTWSWFPHLGSLTQNWKKWQQIEILQSHWSAKYVANFLSQEKQILLRNNTILNYCQSSISTNIQYLLLWQYKLILAWPHRKGS